ncbi:unnamed protein product [Orchesella dallaii]|uniref:Uncharacterized protein n=1 Tax=Orchesella dallaii TaxID=48710 RepID=A0ABP1RSI5_9HEXA
MLLPPEGIFSTSSVPISILLVVACVVMKVVSFLLQRRLDNDGSQAQVGNDNIGDQQGEQVLETSCLNQEVSQGGRNEWRSQARNQNQSHSFPFSFHQNQAPTLSEVSNTSTSSPTSSTRSRRIEASSTST